MQRSYMGRVLKTGAVVGFLVGLLASILAIGAGLFADVKGGTEYTKQMAFPIVLVCLGGSTISVMLLYAVRYARNDLASVLQQNQAVIGPDEWEQIPAGEFPQPPYEERWDEVQTGRYTELSPPLPEGPDTTLGDRIVQCMYRQAEWWYAFQRKPTRAAFERQGTPQPIWNSARDLLKASGVVTDTGWVDLPWATVQARLMRTYVDPDRIWVGQAKGLVPVKYNSQLINNRYTRIAPPQDAA